MECSLLFLCRDIGKERLLLFHVETWARENYYCFLCRDIGIDRLLLFLGREISTERLMLFL